jgi:hypothetical protein
MGFPHAPKPLAELTSAGGAYVRRRFQFGQRELVNGDTLTAEELASIPRANLVALVNTGKLELWPQPPNAEGSHGAMFIAERFAIHKGFGKYIVVEGRSLTPEPVTKDQAEALVAGN